MLYLIVVIYILLLVKSYSESGLNNPFTIIIVTAIPYGMAGVLDFLVFSNTNNFVKESIIQNNLFLIIFLGVVFLIKGREKYYIKNYRYYLVPKITIALPFLICATVLLAYLYMVWGLIYYSEGDRAYIYSNKTTSYDLIRLLIVGLLLLLIQYVKVKNRLWIYVVYGAMLLLFILVEVLLIGDRRLSLMLLLIVFATYYNKERVKKVSFIFFFVFLFLVMLSVGLLRSNSFTIERFYGLFNISKMEFGANQKVFDYCYLEDCSNLNSTYKDIPYQLVPSRFSENRPLIPDSAFSREFDYEYYLSGRTYGYNYLMEANLNGGYFAILFMAVVYGFLFRLYNKTRSEHVKYILGVTLMMSLLFFPRMALISSIKQTFIILILVIIGLFLFFKVLKTNA
ncbi:MAG: O-antigen polysaccharide polymerase Wzy [Saccharospirillum sp.]